MTVPQAFQLAVQHHQAGRLAEAETIYQQILAVAPQHADALHLLGVVALQAGRNEVAVDLIGRAIALSPNQPAFHSNLGEAYRKLGALEEAIAAYEGALRLNPDYAEALSNLGNALVEKGRFAEAIAACRQAVQLKPTFAAAHNNLGNALRSEGEFDEAIAVYRQALELQPGFAEAHSNLGNVLSNQGRLDEAAAEYRRALALQPELPEVHYNLGNALRDQGRLDAAILSYRRALELQLNYAEAHGNLGRVLAHQGRLDEAIGAYGLALQCKPAFAEAHNDLGNALAQQGRLDEASASIHRALELRPDFVEAHNDLGNVLANQGRLNEAIASFRRALELRPGFPEAFSNLGSALQSQGHLDEAIASFRQSLALQPDGVEAHDNLLLSLHYPADLDGEAIFREHCRWDESHARALAQCFEAHTNDPSPGRCLRIGYVSSDFRLHSVAYFLESLLASHDRGQVEVFCYADLRQSDLVTPRLRGKAGQWREITGMTDAQVAEFIRRDQIDILVDLAGHTAGNRLLVFARKPAPVQVTWLGYCDTTGLQAMDYRFTDDHADPPGTTEHLHSEQLIRLPETFACFRPAEEAPPVGPLPALARGHVTFASFHTLAKLNDPLLECWAQILQQVPGSRLRLVAAGLDEASGRQRLREFFGRHGIGPERLEFKGRVPLPEYLALHHEVDLLLDSHPFSGHTVSCHALWMGVPVVTLAGHRHSSRMVASVLANLGLSELIAHTPEQYVEIAAALAADLPRLAALRAGLRQRMTASPLTDGPRFARHVETAYRQIWQTWCNQRTTLPPS